jgi:hypothetical protein
MRVNMHRRQVNTRKHKTELAYIGRAPFKRRPRSPASSLVDFSRRSQQPRAAAKFLGPIGLPRRPGTESRGSINGCIEPRLSLSASSSSPSEKKIKKAGSISVQFTAFVTSCYCILDAHPPQPTKARSQSKRSCRMGH